MYSLLNCVATMHSLSFVCKIIITIWTLFQIGLPIVQFLGAAWLPQLNLNVVDWCCWCCCSGWHSMRVIITIDVSFERNEKDSICNVIWWYLSEFVYCQKFCSKYQCSLSPCNACQFNARSCVFWTYYGCKLFFMKGLNCKIRMTCSFWAIL